MIKLFILVGFVVLGFSHVNEVFAHNGEHTGHLGMVAQEPAGKSYDIPGVTFKIYAKTEEEEAATDVREAILAMLENRGEYPRLDEVIKKDVLQSIVVEPKVLNNEHKEFFILVARTQKPGRVKMMISASQLSDRNLLGHPTELIPILEREFQWVVSKADTAPKPKTMSAERDLQHAQILNDQEIFKLTGDARAKALRSLFDSYLRTVDEQNSLENQPYYEVGSEKLVKPDNKDSTSKLYDIRIRQALEKIVSESEFRKKYPRAVQSLLNGKIWNVTFVKVDQRDWATRTRVLTEEKAVKVGADAQIIQAASVLINYHRKAGMDDPFFNAVPGLPMGALSADELAQVVAIEIETNIIEKSQRGHTVTDQMSAPK